MFIDHVAKNNINPNYGLFYQSSLFIQTTVFNNQTIPTLIPNIYVNSTNFGGY